jgi:hypothetical protein
MRSHDPAGESRAAGETRSGETRMLHRRGASLNLPPLHPQTPAPVLGLALGTANKPQGREPHGWKSAAKPTMLLLTQRGATGRRLWPSWSPALATAHRGHSHVTDKQ